MGPSCMTRSNPTHQLTDRPTQPNVENFGPNLTQPSTTNSGVHSLVATCFYTQISLLGANEILPDRAKMH